MRIGYSFWGFIGNGVIDTPDGGRSHRATLLSALCARGHELVLLQRDRDRLETRAPIEMGPDVTWSEGTPDIDLLWLEWRWPIPGRNTQADKATTGFTEDLERQEELLARYTRRGVPTLVWDKDLKFEREHPLRALEHVTVCEPALWPSDGARTLLFPVADAALDVARRDPPATFGDGELDLVYVGNRYERDAAFERYLAPAAHVLRHRVYGKWIEQECWPEVQFGGRIAFERVGDVYASSLCTVLLLPDRYATAGQMTQRLFESLLAGCLPLLPADVRGAGLFVPPELHVRSATEVIERCRALRARGADRETLRPIIDASLARLERFRVSRQLDGLADLLEPERVRGPAHPFRGRRMVTVLYRTEDRQRRRTKTLLDAKSTGANTSEVIVELARANVPKRPRVLEVGCGRGGILKRLLPVLRPARVVALDLSPAMLRATLARAGDTIEPIQGDFHDLPFEDRAFDLILAAFCLYHSDDPALCCAEIARCLMPGGVAVLATKSADSYAELDALVAAAGADPDAQRHRSLYETFNSANMEQILRISFASVTVSHELHRFLFRTAAQAAEYACTVPKYRGCTDPRQVTSRLARAWPAGGLMMHSTVSFAVAANR